MKKPVLFLVLGLAMVFASCKKDESSTTTTPKTVPATITDIDGNVYHTIKIGTQVWLLENLKVTKYRNGNPIPNVIDSAAWINLTSGAYCDFSNTSSMVGTYGRLYNWYAVNDSRNIAPAGWHVPTFSDFHLLKLYLGPSASTGGKLKETGTLHWMAPNLDATNESGFTALPGGKRMLGMFFALKQHGYWWTNSIDILSEKPNVLYLDYFTGGFNEVSFDTKDAGCSVRLIMD